MLKIIKRAQNLHSGIRGLSRAYQKGNTLRLGVNVGFGQDIGSVNDYNVEFENRENEPVIDCLDYNVVLKVLFPKRIKKVNGHIDRLLDKEGYFTEW